MRQRSLIPQQQAKLAEALKVAQLAEEKGSWRLKPPERLPFLILGCLIPHFFSFCET